MCSMRKSAADSFRLWEFLQRKVHTDTQFHALKAPKTGGKWRRRGARAAIAQTTEAFTV